jgi:hypothetical protein
MAKTATSTTSTTSTNDLGLLEVQITIEGARPLLVHRGGLANPLDPHAKNIKSLSSKRGKTDDDIAELAKREWTGSLYFDEEIGPFLPAEMIEASIVAGGKKHKLGTLLKSGFQVEEMRIPIEYDGPRTLEGLEADGYWLDAVVKVGQAKVVRRRPMFTNWSATFTASVDPTVLDLAQVALAANTAGRLVGMGDWRPRYGRYTAQIAA